VNWVLHGGMEISGNWFSKIDFADDIATVDVDPQSLAAKLADMEHACGDLGLHISWSKTKIQNVGAGSPAQTITVDGQQVEGVDKFTYLGSLLSSTDRSRSEQSRRMGIAYSTMQRMSHVWIPSNLTLATQLCLYMSLIVPILLYASETWTTTNANLAHLQAFHMRCQCRILNVHWYERVTNVSVARRTNLFHIGALIAARRYALFSHVDRLPADVSCNVALRMYMTRP